MGKRGGVRQYFIKDTSGDTHHDPQILSPPPRRRARRLRVRATIRNRIAGPRRRHGPVRSAAVRCHHVLCDKWLAYRRQAARDLQLQSAAGDVRTAGGKMRRRLRDVAQRLGVSRLPSTFLHRTVTRNTCGSGCRAEYLLSCHVEGLRHASPARHDAARHWNRHCH
jgi:hypothetical protein